MEKLLSHFHIPPATPHDGFLRKNYTAVRLATLDSEYGDPLCYQKIALWYQISPSLNLLQACESMSGRYGVLGGNRYIHPGHEACHIFSLQYSSDCYLGESSHPNWCRGQRRECLGSEEVVFGGRREGLGKSTYYSSQVKLTVRVSFLLFESACFRMGNSCRMVSCGRGECRHHHDILAS